MERTISGKAARYATSSNPSGAVPDDKSNVVGAICFEGPPSVAACDEVPVAEAAASSLLSATAMFVLNRAGGPRQQLTTATHRASPGKQRRNVLLGGAGTKRHQKTSIMSPRVKMKTD